MTKIIADISISLDGLVTGPDPNLEHGLGSGGEVLHRWATDSDDPIDREVLRTSTAATGAVIMGRRLFDFVDGPTGWSDQMGYGAREAGTPAFFVVTHQPPQSVRLALDFSFATDGLAAAVARATQAADGRDVVIMGGASVVGQAISGRLVDELRLHLAPVLLGRGTRLFDDEQSCELEQVDARRSRYALHLTYRPVGGARGQAA